MDRGTKGWTERETRHTRRDKKRDRGTKGKAERETGAHSKRRN